MEAQKTTRRGEPAWYFMREMSGLSGDTHVLVTVIRAEARASFAMAIDNREFGYAG